MVRKVDSSGNISLAGTNYRIGNAYRGQQVEVRVVGDTVQISARGRILRPIPSNTIPTKNTAPSPIQEAGPVVSTPPHLTIWGSREVLVIAP